jgi:hypothetical protein
MSTSFREFLFKIFHADSNNLSSILGNFVPILEHLLRQATSFVLTIDEDRAC